MKIIILTISQYKEKDTIIDGISLEGPISFLVKGSLSPKSKHAALNNPLTIIDATFNEGNYKHPVLKSADVIFTPLNTDSDFDYLSTLQAINEVTISLVQPEERHLLFKTLESALHKLKEKQNSILILLIYLAKIFKISGYEFEVNKCVMCESTKSIVAFSFIDGGFICSNCYDENVKRDLTNSQMFLLRAIVNTREIDHLEEYKYSKEDMMVVLNKFFEFIYDNYGVNLHSKNILNN